VTRPVASSLIGFGITVVIAWLLLGLWQYFVGGGDAALAFSYQAHTTLLAGAGFALVAWLILVLVFAFRAARRGGRSATRAYWVGLGWALAVLVLNFVVLVIVGIVAGGWDALYFAFVAFSAGVAVLIGAAIGLAITYFGVFKSRS
jgi:hypothetical protein